MCGTRDRRVTGTASHRRCVADVILLHGLLRLCPARFSRPNLEVGRYVDAERCGCLAIEGHPVRLFQPLNHSCRRLPAAGVSLPPPLPPLPRRRLPAHARRMRGPPPLHPAATPPGAAALGASTSQLLGARATPPRRPDQRLCKPTSSCRRNGFAAVARPVVAGSRPLAEPGRSAAGVSARSPSRRRNPAGAMQRFAKGGELHRGFWRAGVTAEAQGGGGGGGALVPPLPLLGPTRRRAAPAQTQPCPGPRANQAGASGWCRATQEAGNWTSRTSSSTAAYTLYATASMSYSVRREAAASRSSLSTALRRGYQYVSNAIWVCCRTPHEAVHRLLGGFVGFLGPLPGLRYAVHEPPRQLHQSLDLQAPPSMSPRITHHIRRLLGRVCAHLFAVAVR